MTPITIDDEVEQLDVAALPRRNRRNAITTIDAMTMSLADLSMMVTLRGRGSCENIGDHADDDGYDGQGSAYAEPDELSPPKRRNPLGL